MCAFTAPPVEQHGIQEGLAEKANLFSHLAVPVEKVKIMGEIKNLVHFGTKHPTLELCLVTQDEVVEQHEIQVGLKATLFPYLAVPVGKVKMREEIVHFGMKILTRELCLVDEDEVLQGW